MSEQKIDGGPAFPCFGADRVGLDYDIKQTGMTLEDWFAGLAMHALLTQSMNYVSNVSTIAGDAYQISAAMLAERNRPTTEEPPCDPKQS